ncbi:Leucine-rich repeat protein SHOC-2 [Pelomyxa schiedti]|nr:Leucine-rich repeat protein SHOC-2 [Pelomyxa schiedti]
MTAADMSTTTPRTIRISVPERSCILDAMCERLYSPLPATHMRNLLDEVRTTSRTIALQFRDLSEPIKFPHCLLEASWLRSLALCRNNIAVLPDEISNLQSLTLLNLSDNVLTSIPNALCNITELQTLKLSGNRIETLPDNISKLTKLTQLSVASNRLTQLPPAIGTLPCLRELILSNNALQLLPNNIGQLSSLQQLFCDSNKLTEIPPSFGLLNGLTHLDLSYNKLTEFPQCLYTMSAVTSLKLSENNISRFAEPHHLFSNLVSLSTLDLNGNELSTVPPELSSLPHLAFLHLSDNNLSTFPEIWSSHSLVALHLNKNSISSIPSSISNLSTLQILKMSYNDIEVLPPEFAALTLTRCSMNGNRFLNPPMFPPGCSPYVDEVDADQILPNLWLGSLFSSDEKNFLLRKNVTHVIMVLPVENVPYPKLFNYLVLPVDDQEETNLLDHFSVCHKFIDEALDASKGALVHCAAGVSRSATIVISYVMYKKNIGLEEALCFVAALRPVVQPNLGFINQLKQFESLRNSNS